MAVRTVGMHEAKTQLSKLVRELEESGGEVIVTRSGKPVARLLPPETERPWLKARGMFKGQMWISDDFNDRDEEIERLFGTID
ncbi:MAG: type II toxin-antitoxin system prevent-host-death family antitoxin [Patulibacter sp.]